MTEEHIEGGELYKYEACEVPVRKIKILIKKGIWKGSLVEEEVLYNLEKNLYSERYAKKVRKILGVTE